MKTLYECTFCHKQYWKIVTEMPNNAFVKNVTTYTPVDEPDVALSPYSMCCKWGNISELQELYIWEYKPEQQEEVSYPEYEIEDEDGNSLKHLSQMNLRQMIEQADKLEEEINKPVHVWVNIYDDYAGPIRDLIYVISCERQQQ